ncbi:MAG: hypothetical protein JSS72_09380 [Armatimonadetes bacterium]|nr:hypothetical protein [Armatimonadota bacterium]
MSESGGPNSAYSVTYGYNDNGDRKQVTYQTDAGTNRWLYDDYKSLGQADKLSRAFQTLCQLDSSGNHTPEEFHYALDSMGRIRAATFAMSPTAGYSPSGGSTYYTSAYPATSRARAYYAYDSGGRLMGLENYWDSAISAC